MMIPGEWAPRRRSAAAAEPVVPARKTADNSRGDKTPPLVAPPAEWSAGLKVTVFAGTLLAVTWLAMAVFMASSASGSL